jgi:hypothetical protein
MPIQVACGGCQRNLKVPDSLIGKIVKCPKCAHKIKVAAPGKAPANRMAAAGSGKTALKKAPAKPVTGKTSVQSNGKATATPAKAPAAKKTPAAPAKPPPKPTPAKQVGAPPKKPELPPSPISKPTPVPPKPAPISPKKPAKKVDPDEEASRKKLLFWSGGAVIVGVVVVGCVFLFSSSPAKVTGKVTLNGTPVANAKVVFAGDNDPKLGTHPTQTDDKGVYVLSKLPRGKYKVMVEKYALKDGSAPKEPADQSRACRLRET